MIMKKGNHEASNLPVDVVNSINKLKLIIEIIEENLFNPKDDILREIVIIMGDLQTARKIFSLYYPVEGVSLSSYIVKRKKTEAIKAIENIKNPMLADNKIKEITGWSRSYFNRVIKENSNLTEVFDLDELLSNINSVYDNLYNLNKEGLVNLDFKRTKVLIKDINWNVGLKMIFSMREYVSIEENKDMDKLISYDLFLKNYEWMEDYIKTTKNYNPLEVMDYYAKAQVELDGEREDRIMDFLMYYSESKKFNMGELTYYCVDRQIFRSVMKYFILPENLFEYRSIIYKTKLALRLLGKKDAQVQPYIDKFKAMIDDDIEREVFSFFIKNEESSMDGKMEKIYQVLRDTYGNIAEDDVDFAIKNLILRGFISIKPDNK